MTCAEWALALLVFGRAPIPGTAKSRLIPHLGAEGAALLQQRMTEQVLGTACTACVGNVSLWCAPSSEHPFFAACRARYNVTLHTQLGANLGERMRHAHDRIFESHRSLLVIGTDCPILGADHLRAASAELRRRDAVVIPAEDGGYVLLGLARPCPEAFRDIDWGSARVFDQTMQRLRDSGRSICVQPPLWDVDRPEDLRRLLAAMPEILDGLRAAPSKPV